MAFKKGHIPIRPFLKGFTPWNKGKTGVYSEEVKKKMGEARIGKLLTEETKEKIRIAVGGKNHPNYGKHLSKETKEKISNSHKGKTIPRAVRKKISEALSKEKNHNYGKKMSDEQKKKISIAHMGMKPSEESNIKRRKAMKGRKFSDSHRKKISDALKGRIFSQETRRKNSERMIANPNKIFKDTKIELKVEAELQKQNINYQKQVPLCKIAIVDFYLPDHNSVIQCDGCYWHNCPIHNLKPLAGRTEKDRNKDLILYSNGFKVFRFWEHEINKSTEECINRIKQKT